MNIQDEMQKIHHKYGVSEMANYKIEQFVEKLIETDRAEQLKLHIVSKRSLADIEIEYKHPTGKKKGKLKYDDDDETLILDYKGGFITLPNIEDCNVC
jgi:hypothetical protein